MPFLSDERNAIYSEISPNSLGNPSATKAVKNNEMNNTSQNL
jgi:hypothetical protein